MYPVYDHSVPFCPTIPNQNPINTFFPSQIQSRDAYAPPFQNAGYSNPPPQHPYPANFGYNANRSLFFPPPNQRPLYPNLGINTPLYPSTNHSLVHPAYYPNSSSGIACSCGHPSQDPVLTNSNHIPPYPRLVHLGNLVYPLPNSTQFNPPNVNPWPGSLNNTYYQPANPVAGNSTNDNWTYHPNLNPNPSSYTQPVQNPSYVASHNYNAGQHTAASNNRSWLPYTNQNTFRPIPAENNDNLSEFSSDPLSTPSELNLVDSTPDRPAFALPKDPGPNTARSFSRNSSQCTLDICGNHSDVDQNQESQTADATNAVSSQDQPGCSNVQDKPVPTSLNETSLKDSIVANEDLMKFGTQAASSDPVRSDSTTTANESSNNITSTPISTVNTTVIEIDTETVLESNNLGLNNVPNPSVPSADIQNIDVSNANAKNQTLDDSNSSAKNSGNLQIAMEPRSADESALNTTTTSVNLEVENRTTSSTSVDPPSSPMNTTSNSKETDANPNCTSHNILKTKMSQHLSNTTENPNTNSQQQPELKQSLDSSTAKVNYERLSPRCASDDVNLPTQISTNFRHLLIRYLNRLDNVKIPTNSLTSYLNIDDDLVNSFVASLNSESRRLLQQNPNNTGTGNLPNVTQNGSEENRENVGNSVKKGATQTVEPASEQTEENVRNAVKKGAAQTVEPASEQTEENVRNAVKKGAAQTADPESKQSQVIVSNIGRIEAVQTAVPDPEPEQCNVLLDSCADQEETSVSEENSTESQQHLSGYQSADDVDVINTDLDTIEVTVGDLCNNSTEEEFLDVVPLDLAKEKHIPKPEPDVQSRYFEVSQFLPRGNVYWQYFDMPAVQENTAVYAAYDNLNATNRGPHSVDVLVEVPLNLTCKNRATTAESQPEHDIASNYPELSLLLTPETIQNSLNNGANAKKTKEYCLMKKAISKLLTKHPSDGAEPPKKKVCAPREDAKMLRSLLKNDKPKM